MSLKYLSLLLMCLLCFINVNGQVKRIKGVVFSAESKDVLPGATIQIKGSNIGTTTNVDGEFSINKLPRNATMLIVSFVGMESQEVEIKENFLRIYLKETATNMDEVIVMAYGLGKKSSFTGAAESFKGEGLAIRPIASVISGLLGQTPGVQAILADGQPGSTPSLRIRGYGSVNASNDPLYIVDGTVYTGMLGDINPNDIESVTILKDASSTALYGSSAGNGVVQITTKRASIWNSHQVNLKISQGFSSRGIPQYERVGLWDYYPLQWEMIKNQYITGSKQSPEEAAKNASANLYSLLGKFNIFRNVPNDQIVERDGILNSNAELLYDDFNWEDYAYRKGYRAEYLLSYATRGEKSDTYASVSMLDDRGALIETDFKRYTGRINYNIYPVSWFESGINLGAGFTKSKTPMTNMTFTTAKGNFTSFLRRMAPIYPVHLHDVEGNYILDKNGDKTPDFTSSRISLSGRHVIEEAKRNKRGSDRDNYQAHAYVTLRPLNSLKLTINGSIESANERAHVYYNTVVADGAPAGRIQIHHNRYQTYTFNQLLTYEKSIDNNNVELLLGHENFDYRYNYQYVYKQKQIMEGLYELENFTTLSSLKSRTDTYKKEGYFGRINYNYANKFFLSGSYRKDGSSRFSSDSRWGNFWSLGAAYSLHAEPFMSKIEWMNNLKLRISYGETGNDAVLNKGENNYYPWQTLYNTGVNNSKESGLYFSVIGNPNLQWETQRSFDVAVEFKILNCLQGSIEYFTKMSDNLLFNVPVPLSSGSETMWKNMGELKNKGVELVLGYDILKGADLRAHIGTNATFLTNEITKMPRGVDEIIASNKRITRGKSIYDFWLRDYWGVNPANGDVLYVADAKKVDKASPDKIVEMNGKRYTNDADLAAFHYCGSAIPKVYGGFNADLGYRNLTVSLMFAYGLGSKIYDANYADLMRNQIGFAMHKDALKAWRKPGDITKVPRLDASQSNNYAITSDRYLVSGDYLNFQSLVVNYNLPSKWLEGLNLQQVQLIFAGENIAQWNKRKGLNSLANFEGHTYNLYAFAKTYTFSLNVTF